MTKTTVTASGANRSQNLSKTEIAPEKENSWGWENSFHFETSTIKDAFFYLLHILNDCVLLAVLALLCFFGGQTASFLDKPVTIKAKASTFVEVILEWKKICPCFWISSWQQEKKEVSFCCFGDPRRFQLRFSSTKKVATFTTFLVVFLSFLCWADK